MGTTDPRRLIAALTDLRSEGERWLAKARDTIEDTDRIQRHENERTAQMQRESQIVKAQADNDREQVDIAVSRTESLVAQCVEAKEAVEKLLAQCQQAQKRAESTLQHWTHELEKALAWLAKAEARLRKALADLEAAEREHASAKRALSRANGQLQRCRNNKERRNCNSEVYNYNRAVDRVNSAATAVNRAQAEVLAAHAEVEAARARVACCQQAVVAAQEAVIYARQAHELAANGVVEAEKSLDHAHAARRFVGQTEITVAKEVEEAEGMVVHAKKQQDATDEAARHFRSAEHSSTTAQTYLTRNRYELGHRIGLLREVNRVGLTGGGSSGVGNSVSGSVSSVVSPPANQSDQQIKDRQNRDITMREYDAGRSWGVFVYDTSNQSVDEQPTSNIVGRANLNVETDLSGNRTAKLTFIEVNQPYRGSGISHKMLDYVEQGARQRGTSEIWGDIGNSEALSYWKKQAPRGWNIRKVDGHFYGVVYKKL